MSDLDSQLKELRRQAEKRLQDCKNDSVEIQPEQLAEQIHELEVHQIELKIQNEDLQRSQMELETSRDQYAELFDFAPVGYLIIDNKGRIVRTNLLSSEMFGMNRFQMAGVFFYTFVTKEYRRELFRHFQHVFKDQIRKTCEVKIALSDGTVFFAKMDSVVQPRGEKDKLQCLTLITDITKLKKTEVTNKQARQAAEDASRAKSQFLTAVSHDLRQPLQAMTTISDLLKRKLTDKKSLDLVNNLSSCLISMTELFNTLLNVSQLESGSIEPELKTFYANELLNRLDVTYRPLAMDKQLNLRVVDCSSALRCDPVLLYQILDNLVSNAIRYTDSGKVLVGCRRRKSMLRFEIWDTGIGIPENQREQIFDDYHQLYNPARDHSKGLGLGLAIAARSAKLLGQKIALNSWKNGSIFSIDAPLIDYQTNKSKKTSINNLENTKISTTSLLIIDDNSIILHSLSYLMESYGYKVTGTKSSHDAMAMIKDELRPFDFIISDYRLPNGETGIELIKKIRQTLGFNIPALLITGDLEMSMSQEFADSGLKLLHKPVGAEILNQHIQEIMG
ncbi:MAG: ATP-binding protein [Candidatus Thiodiazotropha lotti]|nr:ATP-binding protein [Candidatus Thiodiazotropha lotti]MCG8000535.1 ATP-binding protein [Candidatus Thiodiazotropha lotti]MCW4183393.1 ATP-binding protein [Candidatus Thiodiazotropha weberae]MCW4192306.1 ATP-binding protein [Candidatus Thiodiazotropha weberae]